MKVLIVDDSETARMALRRALGSDPEITVVGEAATGEQAVRGVLNKRPDLVTMDLYLRRENGLDVAASIMQRCARPILVVTGANTRDPELIYRAMESGALDVHAKLPAATRSSYAKERDRLLRLIKTLAKVPVVHRRKRLKSPTVRPPRSGRSTTSQLQCVLMGSSTGGPPVLEKILKSLVSPFPLPVVVVQHLSPGFTTGLAQWLAGATGHHVTVVTRRTELAPGTVYLPADDRHLRFISARHVDLCLDAPRHFVRPSVDLMFESAAAHLGNQAAAVLLTGMGKDGSSGFEKLRQLDCPTIAQRPDTCVVDSMPRHAIELGAARYVLSPREIAEQLNEWGRQRGRIGRSSSLEMAR